MEVMKRTLAEMEAAPPTLPELESLHPSLPPTAIPSTLPQLGNPGLVNFPQQGISQNLQTPGKDPSELYKEKKKAKNRLVVITEEIEREFNSVNESNRSDLGNMDLFSDREESYVPQSDLQSSSQNIL